VKDDEQIASSALRAFDDLQPERGARLERDRLREQAEWTFAVALSKRCQVVSRLVLQLAPGPAVKHAKEKRDLPRRSDLLEKAVKQRRRHGERSRAILPGGIEAEELLFEERIDAKAFDHRARRKLAECDVPGPLCEATGEERKTQRLPAIFFE